MLFSILTPIPNFELLRLMPAVVTDLFPIRITPRWKNWEKRRFYLTHIGSCFARTVVKEDSKSAVSFRLAVTATQMRVLLRRGSCRLSAFENGENNFLVRGGGHRKKLCASRWCIKITIRAGLLSMESLRWRNSQTGACNVPLAHSNGVVPVWDIISKIFIEIFFSVRSSWKCICRMNCRFRPI